MNKLLFALIILLVSLSGAWALEKTQIAADEVRVGDAYTIKLVDNTDRCLACKATYQICNLQPTDLYLTDLNFNLYTPKATYALYDGASKLVSVDNEDFTLKGLQIGLETTQIEIFSVPTYGTCYSNVTLTRMDKNKNVSYTEQHPYTCVTGYTNISEPVTAYRSFERTKAVVPVGECRKIELRGTMTLSEHLDHVPLLLGTEINEFALWNGTYDRGFNLTTVPNQNIALAVNATGGFCGEVFWVNPYQCQGVVSVKYMDADCTDMVVVCNESVVMNWDAEIDRSKANNGAAVYNANALGVYHMSEYAGAAAPQFIDRTPTSYNGTATAGLSNASRVDGVFGYAQDCELDNSPHITVSTFPDLDAYSDITYLGVVNLHSLAAGFVFRNAYSGSYGTRWLGTHSSQKWIGYWGYSGSGWNLLYSTTVAKTNEWETIMGQNDAAVTNYFYMDGKLNSSAASGGGFMNGATGFHFCSNEGGTEEIDAYVDELRIYSTILTLPQYSAFYNNSQNLNMLAGTIEEYSEGAPAGDQCDIPTDGTNHELNLTAGTCMVNGTKNMQGGNLTFVGCGWFKLNGNLTVNKLIKHTDGQGCLNTSVQGRLAING